MKLRSEDYKCYSRINQLIILFQKEKGYTNPGIPFRNMRKPFRTKIEKELKERFREMFIELESIQNDE